MNFRTSHFTEPPSYVGTIFLFRSFVVSKEYHPGPENAIRRLTEKKNQTLEGLRMDGFCFP